MRRRNEYTIGISKRDDPLGWRVYFWLAVLWLAIFTAVALVTW